MYPTELNIRILSSALTVYQYKFLFSVTVKVPYLYFEKIMQDLPSKSLNKLKESWETEQTIVPNSFAYTLDLKNP